jgi:hypothetical protein
MLILPSLLVLLIGVWNVQANTLKETVSHVFSGHSSGGTPTRMITNHTIGGSDRGCKHRTPYFVNANVKFPMCVGQTDQDLKNGMSIINLINSRSFLPTCRVMQLMLWMSSSVQNHGHMSRDLFVDVGANIGMTIILNVFVCFSHSFFETHFTG